MNECPHCHTRIGVDAEHVAGCKVRAERWARVQDMAREATARTPGSPVTPSEATGLYAHLRSHRGLADEQAEAVTGTVLELGWRPWIRTAEPVLVGATQPSLLDEIGGAS